MKREMAGASEQALYRGDPLLWLVKGKLRLPTWLILLLVVVLYAGLNFGLGMLLSYRVHGSDSIIRVMDPEYLPNTLVFALCVVPGIWALYIWQPRGIVRTLESLWQNGVIARDQEKEFAALSGRMLKRLGSAAWPVAGLAITLIMFVVQTLLVYPAETLARDGRAYFWFHDPAYYYLAFTPLKLLIYYPAIVGVSKAVVALVDIGRIFRRIRVEVHPLHPDSAGGLGALGRLATSYGWIGIGVGIFAALYNLHRALTGVAWYQMDTLLMIGAYITVTPIALAAPLWSAHRAMVEHRDRVLGEISAEFDQLMAQEMKPGSPPADQGQRLWQLQSRHKLIEEAFPVWPISSSLFRGFGFTALLPLVLSFAAIVVEILT